MFFGFFAVPVETEQENECSTLRYLSLTSPSGTLSSSLAYSRQLGTHKCPWIISAQPGQYINLTLHDFTPSLAPPDTGGGDGGSGGPGGPASQGSNLDLAGAGGGGGGGGGGVMHHASYCREYAVVTETSSAAIVERCHGDSRVKHVYLSFSHRVQIELRAPQPLDNAPSFIIKYRGKY